MEKRTNTLKKIRSLAVLILLIIPTIIFAQTYDKPGNTSAPFLKIVPTPRGEAMGAAVIGLTDNAAAVFSNPAGLMNITGNDMEFGHTNMPAGIGLSYFSFARKIFGHHAVAISFLGLTTDDMKVRTPLQPEGTGEYFSVGNFAYGITYARDYTDKFRVGFTARLLSLNVSDMYNELSWSGDIGLQYDSDLPGLLEGTIIAVTIRNFGPQITYAKEGYGLPLNYTIGATRPVYNIFSDNDRLALAVNWNKCVDEQEKAQFGMEYSFNDIIALRCGYKFESGEQGATFGLGLNHNILTRKMRFGYSFTPFGMIGSIHKFSLGLGF